MEREESGIDYVRKDALLELMTEELQKSWNKENSTEKDRCYAAALFIARNCVELTPSIKVKEGMVL